MVQSLFLVPRQSGQRNPSLYTGECFLPQKEQRISCLLLHLLPSAIVQL